MPWVVEGEKHTKTRDRAGGKLDKGKKMREKAEASKRVRS